MRINDIITESSNNKLYEGFADKQLSFIKKAFKKIAKGNEYKRDVGMFGTADVDYPDSVEYYHVREGLPTPKQLKYMVSKYKDNVLLKLRAEFGGKIGASSERLVRQMGKNSFVVLHFKLLEREVKRRNLEQELNAMVTKAKEKRKKQQAAIDADNKEWEKWHDEYDKQGMLSKIVGGPETDIG